MGSLKTASVLEGTARPLKPVLLHKKFEEIAEGAGASHIATIFKDGANNTIRQTYAQLNSLTNRLARAMVKASQRNGGQPNSDGDFLVAVSMVPSDRLVTVLMAILKAGGAYLPLDPSFPQSRIEHILKEAQPVLVVSEQYSSCFEKANAILYADLLDLAPEYSDASLKDNEILKHEAGELAIVLYTSGSTGVPKGVRLPHAVIMNRLQWQFNTFPYSRTEKVAVFKTALTFVDSLSEIWGPLVNGLAVLVVPKTITQDPEKLVKLLDEYQIERLTLVPSLLRSILLYLDLQKNPSLLKNLKTWISSGEPLSVSLSADFFKYFPENEHALCNFYGSTEIMGDVTYYTITGLDQLQQLAKVPIGYPIDNTTIYLLDANFEPVKVGEIGELFVSGLNLASGYVKGRDPERFIKNPHASDKDHERIYRTGDYARIERGTLQYEGRTDSQVKVRGHRVDLAEVERAVNAVPGVEKGVVLCYRPGEIDQALLAFVTLQKGQLMSEMQVEGNLQKNLATYMVPQVILLESIPLLVNGKTDRQALLKSYETTNNNPDTEYQVELDYTGVPEDQMKEASVLFETVASVLNRSARGAVTIRSNFYEIGGNSLNSIYTITSLAEHGYRIAIGDFIEAKNLGDVVEKMCKKDLNGHLSSTEIHGFTADLLSDTNKAAVYKIIPESFYAKGDLEMLLAPLVKYNDYIELLDAIWDSLVKTGLSFIVISETGEPVGACLCFDAHDEPEVAIHSELNTIFEYLDYVEQPILRAKLPQGKGKVVHSFMMGTDAKSSTKENIRVAQFMEEEILRLAKRKNYEGVFTTNTSLLTQQLGRDVYGYQVMLDHQVNQFVNMKGARPFGQAPDTHRAIVSWKPL